MYTHSLHSSDSSYSYDTRMQYVFKKSGLPGIFRSKYFLDFTELFNWKLHACGMCVLYMWFAENSDFTELFHWKTNPSNHYVPFLYADHDRYSTVPVEP